MKIFLVDFENVHSDGLAGVDFLAEDDEVVIFHSNNADTITFEMMHKLMFSKAKVSYYKVRRGGRNALDFQMASYLGYLVKVYSDEPADKSVEFFLISKDNGFDFVIDFWESGNINVKPKIKRFFAVKAALAVPKIKSMIGSPLKEKQEQRPVNSIERVMPALEEIPLPEMPEETPVQIIPITPIIKVAQISETPEETLKETPEEIQEEIPGEITAETSEKNQEKISPAPVVEDVVVVAEKKKSSTRKKPPSKTKKTAESEPPKEEPVEEEEQSEVDESSVSQESPESSESCESQEEDIIGTLLSHAKSSHDLYISAVKRFGQKKGVEIYRDIKSRFVSSKTG
ncbi:MAG: PIN domain-containing protein [Oscillospiraceae bacterium]|nr:PIN domain-containing protein [Oscillospiraceae bacterium]